MFAVSGASGRLGRLVLAALLDRVEEAHVVALTRDPAALAAPAADGSATGRLPRVRSRAADFADPTSLVTALDGVRRLLLISTDRTPERPELHRAAVGAAVAAGVEHVVYTSVVRAADAGNPVPEARDHARTERLLAESGLAHTVLRFNVWPQMLTLSRLAPLAVAHGGLPSSAGEGRVGYITREDTAWAAAAVLADGSLADRAARADGRAGAPTAVGGTASGAGRVLDVTGPGLTDADVAAALTEATGRPVRHRPVADEEVADALIALGVAEPMARGWGENDPFRREGWFDVPDDGTTRTLLGREPVTLTGFFAAHYTELLAG